MRSGEEPCGICGKPTVVRYPGNDPENGAARPYCEDGHSTCYRCGKWFQAITRYPESTVRWDEDDPSSEQVVPAGSTESDWCEPCEKEDRKVHCTCGSDGSHLHDGEACCGGEMCCPRANE